MRARKSIADFRSPVHSGVVPGGIRDDGLITNADGKCRRNAAASAQSEMRRAAPDSNVCGGTLAPPLPDTANPKTEQGCPTDDDHGETEVEPWNRRFLVRRGAFDVRHIRHD